MYKELAASTRTVSEPGPLVVVNVATIGCSHDDPFHRQIAICGDTPASNVPATAGFLTIGASQKKCGLPACAPSTMESAGARGDTSVCRESLHEIAVRANARIETRATAS
jgi:hypothetical protein